MDTSKCFKLFLISVLLFSTSCNRDEYFISEKPFDRIFIENWIADTKPEKIILEEHEKGSEFNLKKNEITDFDIFIEDNDDEYTLFLTPKSIWKGKLTKDLILKIDDSILFEISEIKTSLDTIKKTFALGREFHICNSVDSLSVNGNKLINNSSDILLSMNIAKNAQK